MLHPEMYYFVQKECTPGAWHAENHRISNYSLVFVMEGGAHYTIDGQNYEPKVGNVIFISRAACVLILPKACAARQSTFGCRKGKT